MKKIALLLLGLILIITATPLPTSNKAEAQDVQTAAWDHVDTPVSNAGTVSEESIIYSYGHFDAEQVAQLKQQFTPVMLMAAAYFYPELTHLLDPTQIQSLLNWDEQSIRTMVDKMNSDEIALLQRFTPLVTDYRNEAPSTVTESVYGDGNDLPTVSGSVYGKGENAIAGTNSLIAAAAAPNNLAYSLKDATFKYQQDTQGDVDPTLRAFHQRDVDIYLPGREGLDISLVRSYSSNSSYTWSPYYGCEGMVSTPCSVSDIGSLSDNLVNMITNAGDSSDNNFIASGWSLNLPAMTSGSYLDFDMRIDDRYPYAPPYGKAMYTTGMQGKSSDIVSFTVEDGTTYKFLTSAPNKSISSPYEDARMEYSVYNAQKQRFESRLYLNNDKLIYLFDSNGRLLEKANAYGDKVTYAYADDSTYPDTTITDSLNQKIVIERRGSGSRITGISVSNSSGALIKRIVYNTEYVGSNEPLVLNGRAYGNTQYVITYYRLASVSDAVNSKTLKTYTYYEPSAKTVVDFNFEDDWVMSYNDTEGAVLEVKDSDGTGIESDYVDHATNGETLSLLLKDVTDDTGFKTTVQYASYDKNWRSYPTYKERDAHRGTVHLYLDGYLLKYTGYLPVVNIFYSYKNSDNAAKSLQMSVTADNTAKANEIWMRPKKRITDLPYSKYLPIHRLEQAGAFRSGDKVNNTFTYYYGDYKTKTSYAYSATKLGQLQLDAVTNETVPLTNGLSFTANGYSYANAPKQIVSYQYDDGKTKPYLTKTFGDGAPNDNTPAAIKDFLRNGNSRTLPANIEKYSTLVKTEYDAYGNLTYQEDALGNKVESQYAGPYRQVSYTKQTASDGLSSVEQSYVYNADGTVNKATKTSSYRDPNSSSQVLQDTVTTDYLSYTTSKLPTRFIENSTGAQYSTNANVKEMNLEYDAKLMNVTKETVSAKLGSGQAKSTIVKQYAYDQLERLRSVTYPDNSRAEYTYDYKDRILTDTFVSSVTTAASRTTSYAYNDANRTIDVVSPDGERISTTFTPYGEVDKQMRSIGAASKIILKNETDSSGSLLKAALPYNDSAQKTTYLYGANGQISEVTDPLGQKTSFYYSNAAYATNGAEGNLQQTVKTVEPDGKETWTYNDKLGRKIRVEEKSPTKLRVSTYAYTPWGFLSSMNVTSNGKSQSTYYAYDAKGQLINVRDSLGQKYDYVYNSSGQVTNVKINAKTKTTNVFNEIGQLIQKANADGQSEAYTYKTNGLLDSFVDKKGLTHTSGYTAYNEVESETIKNASGTQVYARNYVYDPTTRLLTGISTSENESQAFHYDQWKRQDQQIVAGRTYAMGYDNNDRLSTLTYPDNQAVTYTYDNLSRLKSVYYPGMGGVSNSYETSSNSNKYTQTSPYGIKQVRVTDAFDELTSVTHSNSVGATLWSETFGYDGMGNITNINENGAATDYLYDDLNRIKQEKPPSGKNTYYSYDGAGNISALVSSASDTEETFIPSRSYSYNALNQLSGYSTDTTTASYTYYGDGLRATKTVNGVKTRYVYLNGRVIEELDASGNPIGRNIWGNELLYRVDYTKNKAGYYSYNGHGDVIAIRDSSGAVLNKYDYDIWGKITSYVEQMSNPFRYSGEIYDDESGLIYLRARYYDPSDKRFISEDSYEGELTNPLSLNLYTYVYNNPLNYTDPTGNMGRPTCANWDNECRAKGEFDRQLQIAHRAPTIAAVEIMADNLLNSNPVGTGVASSIRSIGYAIKYVSGILKAVFTESKALKVLNLGAGENIISGVINSDVKTGKGIDLVIDATKALPYADESIDAMIALNPYGYAAVNSFTTAALKPGGTFTLVGTISNPWFKVFYNASAEDLKLLGYEVVSTGKAEEAYKYGTKTTDGTDINPEKLMQIVLRKIGG